VDSHGIKVFHVTHGYAVIKSVPDHLILDFLPSGEIFLDQNLGAVSERCGCSLAQFLRVQTYARTKPAKGISNAQHDWIADSLGGTYRSLNRIRG
jgi:hypothetical protein